MYFNIGMKTVYLEVFQQVFKFPPITTKKGQILWYCLGPVYWILAFLVAAAVPNINGEFRGRRSSLVDVLTSINRHCLPRWRPVHDQLHLQLPGYVVLGPHHAESSNPAR